MMAIAPLSLRERAGVRGTRGRPGWSLPFLDRPLPKWRCPTYPSNPTMATLIRYAEALGKKLVVNFE
jgi:hypothetical protein